MPETDATVPLPAPPPLNEVTVRAPGGRPMLNWLGKRAVRSVAAFPAQLIEVFDPVGESSRAQAPGTVEGPNYALPDVGGLLFHGDNKEVLGHLLAGGLREQVKLIYIDPPFDSGADYVRNVQLRGVAHGEALSGEAYSLGEQIQYTDIWSNDTYLQFMYERLLLLKELLADGGSIWLHCDWHKSHHLRCLMDEVFGADALVNEVIWQRTDPHNDAKSRLGNVHDTLLWYRKGEKATYNWSEVIEPLSEAALREYSLIRLFETGEIVPYRPELDATGDRFKLDDCTWKGSDPSRKFTWRGARPSDKRCWPYPSVEEMDAAVDRGDLHLRNPDRGAARCRVSYLKNREGQVLQSIWTAVGRMKGGNDYPTEKPHALLARIIQACTSEGDLVLDCFAGSGVTLTAAQVLGRRWIGADINRGSIALTSKRMQSLITQATSGVMDPEAPKPALKRFSVLRVNDYDLAVQHNEAVNLACELLGVSRTRSDSFFDGHLGDRLAKIVPFNHPLGPLDLEEVRRDLAMRPGESRDVVLISLGKTLSSDAWLEDYNRHRNRAGGLNRIEVIELKTDARYGHLMTHEPARARVEVTRQEDQLKVRIVDFISPTIVQRLGIDLAGGAIEARLPNWRSMVDSVMIDPAYDDQVFRITLSDLPESRTDIVSGEYQLPAVEGAMTVAVKIVDMLGEEVLVITGVPG